MNELEIVQYRNIDGLQLFMNSVDYRTSHFHPEWELIWIFDHPLYVSFSRNQDILQPGEMILFAPNEPHEFHRIQEPSTFLCLQISPKILPFIKKMTLDSHMPLPFMSEAETRNLKLALLDLANAYFQQNENYELYCCGSACLILYEIFHFLPHHTMTSGTAMGIDKRTARLNRLIHFVDEHYMEKIRLEDFARQEHCSTAYISRFIKENLNQTFREYVTSVRFHCACKLIAEGNSSMLDVCIASGFSDYHYFSKAFQDNYHMTPEKYSHSRRPQLLTVHHSLHSIEQIYSREDSLRILKEYADKI